jgi:hypothetical protein
VIREPRTTTVLRQVDDALRSHKRLTERALADAVVDLYHDRTALHDRTIPFHAGHTPDAYEAAARANAQLLKRMRVGEVRMPADLEEALVLALPEPQQRACLVELADRYGLLAVPKPSADGVAQHGVLAEFLRQMSEAVERIAPMLADGVIDVRDREHAPAAIKELTDVITAASSLLHLISAATSAPAVSSLPRKAV